MQVERITAKCCESIFCKRRFNPIKPVQHWNHELISVNNALVRHLVRVTTFHRFGLLGCKIGTHGIHTLRPVIGDEQAVHAFDTADLEAHGFMQFAFEDRRGWDDVLDRGQNGIICIARYTDLQRSDRGSIAEVVECFQLTGFNPQVQACDR